jgi:hypothetical protein
MGKSGVYFFTLPAGGFVFTRKAILPRSRQGFQ